MAKRLLVCCDGTWNTADQAFSGDPCPTNVTRVAQAIAHADRLGVEQRCFYEEGVGVDRWERLRGGAFGFGLSHKVRNAYRFLVDNFEPGDEIFLFGFSRGAFTARSTAGFVRNAGILRREHAERVDEAYALYRSRDKAPHSDEAQRFRDAYSRTTRIRFIGVWDTVGALGIPISGLRAVNLLNRRWQFHDTDLSSWVDAAFQALAIDEERNSFEPTLWKSDPDATQRVEQVWFSGVHCDVGGGYPEPALAEIALLWLVDRARECGLEFAANAFPPPPPGAGRGPRHRIHHVDPDPLGELHQSRGAFYRFLPRLVRGPGAKDPHSEYVASSAVKRHELDRTYAPAGLVEYLREAGRVMQLEDAQR